MSSDMNRRGVIGFRRDAGVGVDMGMAIEVERNGSGLVARLPHDEPGRGKKGMPRVEEDALGRSSKEGGVIPNSVYSQSIWTKLAES